MAGIRIEIPCEAVTPMITAGADTAKFDLRAPAVKGALRFWWRAFHSTANTKDLAEKEAALFGDTSGAAPFRLRIEHLQDDSKKAAETDNDKKDDKKGPTYSELGLERHGHKRGYFYFPLRGDGAKGSDECPRAAWPSFKLIFDGIRGEERTRDLLYSLWLLEHLGGIGGRTRRGAGSFRVLRIVPTGFSRKGLGLYEEQLPERFKSEEAARKAFQDGLQAVLARWQPAGGGISYTAYSDAARFFMVVDNDADCLALMDTLADKMITYRKADIAGGKGGAFLKQAIALHGRIDDVLSGARPPAPAIPFTKPAFGLPIQYRFGSLKKPPEPEPIMFEAEPNSEGQRRASPLFFSFGKVAVGKEDRAVCRISFLPAPFLPAGGKVRFAGKLDKRSVIKQIDKNAQSIKTLDARLKALPPQSPQVANVQKERKLEIDRNAKLNRRLSDATAIADHKGRVNAAEFLADPPDPHYAPITEFLRILRKDKSLNIKEVPGKYT